MVRAAVCRAFGEPLAIEEIELAPPGPGEVSIRMKACAICHSDISFMRGEWGGALPAVYGHEASGVVEAVGEGVQAFKPGDRVVATLIRSCGTCHYCSQGSLVMCEEVFDLDKSDPIRSPSGESLHQAMRTGAFAEKILVHESQIVAIPDEMPFDEASLLACGVITGYGAAVNTAKVKPGQAVIVIGCGGVGLNVVQGAAISGAHPVIAMDLAPGKIAAAKGFGATHGVDPTAADAVETIKALTHGRGADVVFVAVGAKTAINGAFDYITRNGTVVIVGMPASGVLASYDPSTLAAWNQKILGSKMGESVIARDIPALIEAWQDGRLKLAELISGRYPLDRINEAVEAVMSGGALRNVIVFDD